jgi:Tat protein secretion system quality control protein TatD with DNase activity
VAAALAGIRGLDLAAVVAQTTANARALFRLPADEGDPAP